MISLSDKTEILGALHFRLASSVERVASSAFSDKQKAQQVNALVAEQKTLLMADVPSLPNEQRGTAALIVQYCCTVVGLEYRHSVWPYEYMAFSRRVGELWEAFCCTAWTYPVDKTLMRISPPEFSDVRRVLLEKIVDNLGIHERSAAIMSDVSTLFEIIGDINMREDEVFSKSGIPGVVDFKSGFGSNEKGNMLRLLTVGKAYKIWDDRTNLMLLVRQEENNNYLRVLRRSKLWEVHTGREAYRQIEAITGTDIQSIRDNIVDWRQDLSESFYMHLKRQPSDLTSYLMW